MQTKKQIKAVDDAVSTLKEFFSQLVEGEVSKISLSFDSTSNTANLTDAEVGENGEVKKVRGIRLDASNESYCCYMEDGVYKCEPC